MTIKWNGRNAEDAINKAVFPQVRDNVAKLLRETRCPEHGTGPTSVTVTGHNLKSLTWHAQGCCQNLTDTMKRRFNTR